MKPMPRNDTTHQITELSFLYKLGRALSSTFDLYSLLDSALQLMATELGMKRGTIAILDRNTQKIMVSAAHGLSKSARARGQYELGEGITGKVIETGRPIAVPIIADEPGFLDRTGARSKMEKKHISFICVPIKVGGEVVGALSADRVFAGPVPLEEDLRVCGVIASMLAQTVKARRELDERNARLNAENLRLKDELGRRHRPENMLGNSPEMAEVYALVHRVAPADTTVLIRGESGVGKELVAAAIHQQSPRKNRRMVTVNCAALPETLIETELFGHERGAFTGALSAKAGRIEIAAGSTLFLDEIGDLGPALQIKLLRVLQFKEYERVGSAKTRYADIRVIAATHRNLEQMIKEGAFRQDLYYRLNVFPIYLPPLRQRTADILLLANHFAEFYGELHKKPITRISAPAIDLLTNCRWPGNVRELENCIERAVLLTDDGVIHGRNLPPTVQTEETTHTEPDQSLDIMVSNFERDIIIEALKATRGNQSAAARHLETTKRIMLYKVKKHGIDPSRWVT